MLTAEIEKSKLKSETDRNADQFEKEKKINAFCPPKMPQKSMCG